MPPAILKSLFGPYLRLPPTMWVVFSIQVINRMGDFITPFITLYLTRRLGMSEADTGFFVTATIVAGVLGTLVAGKYSDRLGRKPILQAGMGLSALTIGVCGFLPEGYWIPWILVGASFFQGTIRPVLSALIADLSTGPQRKDAYALSYLGINLGVAIGPMIAGWLFVSYRSWLFWGDALSTVAAMILLALFIPARTHDLHPAAESEKAHEGPALAAFFARPLLVVFCGLLLVVNFMYSQTHFALPLSTTHAFADDGALVFGSLMSFNAVVVLVLTPLISHVSRHQSPLSSMALGAGLYGLGFGLMAFPLSMPLLWASTFIWTLGEIWFSINTGVYLASHTPLNLRGRFQSYREFITSVGRIASPAVCGAMVAGFGLSAVWALVGALGLLVTLGFLLMIRAESTAPKSPA